LIGDYDVHWATWPVTGAQGFAFRWQAIGHVDPGNDGNGPLEAVCPHGSAATGQNKHCHRQRRNDAAERVFLAVRGESPTIPMRGEAITIPADHRLIRHNI
jgi:hypothetical protein